ncbi:hypothetical protein FA95DRAFT_1556126, partial [Auriscalpium vulgare]
MAASDSSSVRYPTPPPPPTLNTLDPVQRTRLIRSARKLGSVLGATPFVLESHGALVPVTILPASATRSRFPHSHSRSLPSPASPSDPAQRRRQGSVFDLSVDIPSPESTPRSSTSSRSSPASTPRTSVESLPMPSSMSFKSRRAADAPTPLILRLNAVPLSPTDPRAQSLPVTPTTATLPVPNTPTTPTQADTRRRKMARVMRTLGENVPPELVFHQASTPSLDLQAGFSLPASPTVHKTVARADAPSPAQTPKAHAFPTGPPLPPPSPSRFVFQRPRARMPSATKKHRRRSVTISAVPPTRFYMPPAVFASGARAPSGERWVGEWNRKDIHQVQRELRTMR